MVTKNGIKCNSCGKFIAYKDIVEGKIKYNYTPETEFGHEKHEHYCVRCQ